MQTVLLVVSQWRIANIKKRAIHIRVANKPNPLSTPK